jgi:hypothetical protein
MKVEYLADGLNECPLIRLYEYNQSEVRRLREIGRALASGAPQSRPLHSEPWVLPIDGCRLTLRPGSRSIGVRNVAPLTFECVLSPTGWSNFEGLLDPFCDSDTNGFQWLTHDGKISLLISQNGQW